MKLLVVLSRFPYPREKGDKLRAYHQIRCLAEKHEVYLAAMHYHPVAESDIQQLKPFCKDIFLLDNTILRRCWNVGRAFLKGLPLQCGMFYSRRNARELDRIVHTVQPDHIYCQLFRMAEYVMDYPIPKTLDYQDVFSKGIDRLIPKSPWWKRGLLRAEYRRVCRYERLVFDRFDHCTIITQVDRSLIRHPRAREIVVVPNGVDTTYYSAQPQQKQFDLIFTGNMGYMPNIDAAECIVREIFPAIREKYPDIRIALCGANPSPRVLALENKQVTVTGWVDDMREYYAKSRIFIAPMRLGTGLQNKLLEAMAMGIPCITSPLAATPLNAQANQEILVCNSTLGYIDAIDNLLKDAEHYARIARNGQAFVQANYNWEHTSRILEELITE